MMMQRMTEEEYDEATLAVHEGRACELFRCPIDGTLQGVERRARVRGTYRDFNESENIELRCGHWLV